MRRIANHDATIVKSSDRESESSFRNLNFYVFNIKPSCTVHSLATISFFRLIDLHITKENKTCYVKYSL